MKKFEAIESLRGYMAWWVVFGHAMHLTGAASLLPAPMAFLLGHGDWAVRVFMIVSGFVIAHLLVTKDEPYAPYLMRRGMRIFPLYLAMLLVALIVRQPYAVAYTENLFAFGREMRLDRWVAEGQLWFVHLPLHMLGLHGAVPDTVLQYSSSTYLAPAWSISLEWQFYLLAPFILSAMRSGGKRSWLILLAVLLVSAIALFGLLGKWKYESFFFCALPFFLVGMCSRLIFSRNLTWAAVAVTVVSGLLFVAVKHGLTSLLGYAVIGVIWSFFCAVAARESGLLSFGGRLMDRFAWVIALNPVATALGRVSYSTYLVHIPIFSIVVGGGMMLTGRRDQPFILMATGVALLLVIPASFALHRWVEMPGNRLGSKLAGRLAAKAASSGPLAEAPPVK